MVKHALILSDEVGRGEGPLAAGPAAAARPAAAAPDTSSPVSRSSRSAAQSARADQSVIALPLVRGLPPWPRARPGDPPARWQPRLQEFSRPVDLYPVPPTARPARRPR